MEITLAVILSYISNYLLSFVISLLGAFTTEMMAAIKKKNRIDLFRLLAPSIFVGFLMCALPVYIHMTFAVYAFLCFMMGMWGLHILETICNHKFVFAFFRSILKQSSTTIAKAAEEGLAETEKKKDKKPDENNNGVGT